MSLALEEIPTLVGLIIIVAIAVSLLIFIIWDMVKAQKEKPKTNTSRMKNKLMDYFAEQDKKMD